MQCCIIDVLFTKLFKFEIQKYGHTLCAHKPYYLMLGHIYSNLQCMNITTHTTYTVITETII